jgi:catechol 2,3-dioxygenase-like lactoylglutathione lyase family enzyme
MIRKLAHLCLVTDDLPRLAEFYSKKLGLPIKFTFQNPEGEVFGHYFDAGDTSFVEIFDRKLMHKQWMAKDGKPLLELADPQTARPRHFCFEVTALADLVKTLESRGVKCGPIRQGMDRSLQAWTADPDGNPIEFMEYTAESQQIRRSTGTPPVVK